MLNKLLILLAPFLVLYLSFMSKKFKFLSSFTGEKHQKFAEKNSIPLIGGFFLLIGTSIFFYQLSLDILIFVFLIFFLGLASDLKILVSPLKRFCIQLLIIILFIIHNEIFINDIRIYLINNLLENKIFNYIFVLIAFMVVINGSNFIDGLNTLLIGYYTIITFFLIKLNLFESLNISSGEFDLWIIFLLILFVFNFFKRFFFGDSGAYLISFIYSFFLIEIYKNSSQISPYFIVNLIWFPCFELLFSIIRKLQFNRSPMEPDINHLHQLVFFYFSKKLKTLKNLSNSISANIINFFNFLIIYMAVQNVYFTLYQLFITIFSSAVYIFVYLLLTRFKKKFKN